jgi:chemotaxis protein MotA
MNVPMTTTPDLTQALGPFLDPTAMAIVFGGTLLAVMLRTPMRDLGRAIAALRTLGRRRFDAAPLIEQIAALGRIARRHGVMALDRSVIADADVAAAVAAIVDGQPPDHVEELLRYRRRARIERHAAAADIWNGAAEVAPAMGMVGTLIGLVGMFVKMQDPGAIGASMAVALLATLYGALLANLVAMPIAIRLRRLGRDEAVERLRLEAPLVALAERERPRAAAIMPMSNVA